MTQQIVDLGIPDLNIRKLGAAFGHEAVRHVKVGGNDDDDGRTWATAKATVQNAVNDLPVAGAGGQARHNGKVIVGPGLYVEDGTPHSGGAVIECNSNLFIEGATFEDSGDSGPGTEIRLGADAHLFGPTAEFTDWGHRIKFSNLRLNGGGRVGAYDLVRVRSGGFGTRLEDVFLSQAPRYGLDIIDTAVNFYLYNCTGAGCGTAWLHLSLAASANLVNVGIYGAQVDDCTDCIVIDDSSSGGVNIFSVYGLETEAAAAGAQHPQVIKYNPIGGTNGIWLNVGGISAFKSGGGATAVILETDNTGGRCQYSQHGPVLGDGYTWAFQSDKNITSTFGPKQIKAGAMGVGYAGTNGMAMFLGNVQLIQGKGSPENNVAAPVGSLFTREDGGAGSTLYVKESGTGNTGWVGK